ncbi:DUF2155 domain-containing protein [Vannielia litorea]|uniref:DUF2155 domain-containing protein n=1 Tax=Vannielia litorea TaxID=1217970 RepID=A0A1N6G5K9_9RHOB|nr:DUF2155 domain-containing protein [Vannielia litorea]SIO02787.1 hypothetical protein SAMN05444002_2222 [Vannielia litorea]
MKTVVQCAALACLLAGAAQAQEVLQGPGAMLRGLDKLSSVTSDLEVRTGETVRYGHLRITLSDCRYPEGTPARASAYVVIEDDNAEAPAFAGWMLASAPALNALDHQRYDVWVLRCTTE